MKKSKKTESTSRNPAGRPKSEAKRLAIMDAAENAFMEHGYEKTSMDLIAQLADVSKLTIYSHFADKDALFKAIITRKCQQHNNPDSFSELHQLPIKTALEIIGHNFVNLILSKEAICMHRLVESESLRHPKIAQLFYEAGPKHVKSEFINLLKDWTKAKILKIADYELAADQFFSLLKGEAHMKLILNLPINFPNSTSVREPLKHIAGAVNMFLKTYLPKKSSVSRGRSSSIEATD
jgi:TetR/AcrR family transcriptional repressor of mexJK operon